MNETRTFDSHIDSGMLWDNLRRVAKIRETIESLGLDQKKHVEYSGDVDWTTVTIKYQPSSGGYGFSFTYDKVTCDAAYFHIPETTWFYTVVWHGWEESLNFASDTFSVALARFQAQLDALEDIVPIDSNTDHVKDRIAEVIRSKV